MNEFRVGDRVRCVDATPLPINVPGAVATDFSFPRGFVAEGAVYVVERVGINSRRRPSLRLVGCPVLHAGVEISWDSLRFRRLQGSPGASRQQKMRKQCKQCKQPKSSKQKTAVAS